MGRTAVEVGDASGGVDNASDEVNDVSGEVGNPSDEVNDASGEVNNPFVEVSDVSGEVDNPSVEVSDAFAEIDNASAEVADVSGRKTVPVQRWTTSCGTPGRSSRVERGRVRTGLAADREDAQLARPAACGGQAAARIHDPVMA